MAVPGTGVAAEATATITVRAQVSSRTALTVSTQSLQFDVVNPAEAATASVDFLASARTHAGAHVVLSIEVLRTVGEGQDRGGAAAALSFTGHGEGTRGGMVGAVVPAVAARWTGSGRRSGRLVFALRSRAAGSYAVPVRFVLTAP